MDNELGKPFGNYLSVREDLGNWGYLSSTGWLWNVLMFREEVPLRSPKKEKNDVQCESLGMEVSKSSLSPILVLAAYSSQAKDSSPRLSDALRFDAAFVQTRN